FHWFNGEAALKEFHRLLRPGGKLGLLWNVRDERVEWVERLTEILCQYDPGTPSYRKGLWKAAFETTKFFKPLKYSHFTYVQTGNLATMLDRVASISFIAALPLEQKREVLEKVTELLRTHPETRASALFELPYRTDVYSTERQ